MVTAPQAAIVLVGTRLVLIIVVCHLNVLTVIRVLILRLIHQLEVVLVGLGLVLGRLGVSLVL